jgi:hypothetical protein
MRRFMAAKNQNLNHREHRKTQGKPNHPADFPPVLLCALSLVKAFDVSRPIMSPYEPREDC